MLNPDVIGMVVGAVLTLMVFSYLLGDNPLYRLALYLFVGAVVGYALGITIREVFLVKVIRQLVNQDLWVLVPIVLGLLLLVKGISRTARVGYIPIAFLIGVGGAVALSGALMGTLIPQVAATGEALAFRSFTLVSVLRGLLIVLGTVCTLMVFNFGVQQEQTLGGLWGLIVGAMSRVGRVFLVCALATAFAGAVTTALTVFVGRGQSLIEAGLQLAELLGI